MIGTPSLLEEVAGEDAHVAGEHDEVAVALAAARAARARSGTARGGRGCRSRRRRARWSGWLEATSVISASSSPRRWRHSRSTRQWSSLLTEHRHPLRRVGVGEPPAACRTAPPTSCCERAPERAEVALLEVELHAHEELAALGVGRVLVGADDVRAGVGEEARDGGDDAVPVGAGDEQAAVHASSEATSRERVHASLGERVAAAGREQQRRGRAAGRRRRAGAARRR